MAPPRQIGRLAGAKRPNVNSLSSYRSRVPAKKVKKVCECDAGPTPETDDQGSTVCGRCGTLISESNIVSEVTFGETSVGAAIVQGGQVAEDQRFAKTQLAPGLRRGLGTDSREQTERNGRGYVERTAHYLGRPEYVRDQAFGVYKLALANNFTHGRNPQLVAAVCVYYICRQQPDNRILLMDISEQLSINVFTVGDLYKTMVNALFLEDYKDKLRPVEVEPLIDKFAERLDFGEFKRQVASDAVMILSRMNRDWMVTGRTPAGLCGACLILAARMNNFRRSVREVVYVVRVADVTIAKRLEEFKRTKAGTLSVDQFRTFSHRLKDTALPPAIYNAQKKATKKVKRSRQEAGIDADVESPAELAAGSCQESEISESSSRKRQRIDADGFAIPEIPTNRGEPPIDPELDNPNFNFNLAIGVAQESLGEDPIAVNEIEDAEVSDAESTTSTASRSRKRGRSKKMKQPPPVITEADLIVENELEEVIEQTLRSDETRRIMEEAQKKNFAKNVEARALAMANVLRGSNSALDATTIDEDEFKNDPEVTNCLLNPAEIAIKEKIWVTHNEDWMRAQQDRIFQKEMAEAKGKKVVKRGKRARIGDGSILEGSVINSPADAAQLMLSKKASAGFSKNIDYAVLRKIYGDSAATPSSEDPAEEQSAPGSPVSGHGPTGTQLSQPGQLYPETITAPAVTSTTAKHLTPPATQPSQSNLTDAINIPSDPESEDYDDEEEEEVEPEEEPQEEEPQQEDDDDDDDQEEVMEEEDWGPTYL